MRTEIPDALEGDRVDRVVATLTGLSRSQVASLVDAGKVRLAGEPVRASRRVTGGEVLDVVLPPAPPSGLLPDPGVPVTVVHADDHLIVVDKPAGLVVHPGAGHERGTLAHGLLARFPDLAGVGEPDRPGIVHRLDRLTSGLLAVARTEAARADLTAQLGRRTMSRHYLALVWGEVEDGAGVVDAPVGRSDRHPTRMAVVAGGRPARTAYEVRRRYPGATLVACRLETGRTHQIRVHLAAIGHPVVGDGEYGGRRPDLSLDRLFLHAGRLGLDHPATGERMELHSALPPELEAVLDGLAAPYPSGSDRDGPA